MARITNGILGKAKGKVGGVVAATWKGINYVREYVIPANPRSTSQVAVRTSFATIIFIGRAIMLTYIRTYWDKLVKGKATSGFAKFTGVNQKLIAGTTDYHHLKLATGGLENVKGIEIVASKSNGFIEIEYLDDTVGSGLPGDHVLAYAFSDDRKYLYPQDSAATRDNAPIRITIPALKIDEVFYIYIDCFNDEGVFSTTIGFEVIVVA